jgi:hypothetical protein
MAAKNNNRGTTAEIIILEHFGRFSFRMGGILLFSLRDFFWYHAFF